MSTGTKPGDGWVVVDALFQQHGLRELVRHQIDSYDHFVSHSLIDVVNLFNPIETPFRFNEQAGKHELIIKINMKNPVLARPIITEKNGYVKPMTPQEARLRNFTYAGNLNIDVDITVQCLREDGMYDSQTREFKRVMIGRIPIMIGSNYCITTSEPTTHINLGRECQFDKGGYFIINGNEKVVVSQDRVQENRTFVFPNTKSNNYSHVAEIRSVMDNVFSPPKLTLLKLSSRPNEYGRYIRANIHHVRVDIPLFVLFRVLGVLSDRDIIRHIVYDLDAKESDVIMLELQGSVHDAHGIYTQEAALEYMVRSINLGNFPREVLSNNATRIRILTELIEKEVLPHVGPDPRRKALYLGYMTRRLIKQALGLAKPDDRDSYISKRVDSSGTLLASIFRQYYGKMAKEIRKMLNKELHAAGAFALGMYDIVTPHNIGRIIKPTIIDSGLKYSLSTGIWGLKSNKNTRHGVAQVLNRMTYSSSLSHLRRNNTPVEKSGKMVQPRRLHATQFGTICPSETPEGASVGVVKNMALTTHITVHTDSNDVRGLVERVGIDTSLEPLAKNTKVFINGDLLGSTEKPSAIYESVRRGKRSGAIGIYTGVSWNRLENLIIISTEAGRYMRPLFVVEDGKCLFTEEIAVKLKRGEIQWHDLVCTLDGHSCIEHLDVLECSTALIAMSPDDLSKGLRYTHMELHPSMMLGVLASIIPFSDHNQSPRNSYQSAMGKQAIGIYTSNYNQRYDTLAHILNYPQKPLVATRSSKYLNFDSLPNGANVIVAIMTYTGFNQEDAVIANKSSLERGLFNSTFFRTVRELNNRNHATGEEEFFCNPVEHCAKGLRPANYGKLGPDGFIPENTYVTDGDILIGKCMPVKVDGDIELRDASIMMKSGESGYVDRNCHTNNNFVTTNGDGYEFAKVRIRSFRMPTIGDKLSSRHGQKGTIGIAYSQEDMPFTKDGIVPDLIINPHAIPSRMTVGQLMECILGKAASLVGCYGDGTPFSKVTVSSIAETLRSCGYEGYGNEVMYDGRTGEMIHTNIFIGPTFYQRLKHMVCDKVHCLTMDHEVLTSEGWRRYPDLTTESKIATLNADGDVEYQKPYEVMYYPDYNGDILKVETSDISMAVTDEHRMYISQDGGKSFCLKRATDIYGQDAIYSKTAGWRGEEGFIVNRQDLLALGAYIASCEAATPISSKKARQGVKLAVTNGAVLDADDYIIGSTMPPWVFRLPQSHAYVLVNAIYGATGGSTFFSKSKNIADQFQQLCLHAGQSCNVLRTPTGWGMRRKKTHGQVAGKDQVMVPFSGPVFCVRVPNEVFYVRRNGKGVWTGNSRAGNGPLVMLTRQPAEGRARDGGLRIGEMEVECIWASGMMGFMKERFVDCSDGFLMWLCARCHRMAVVNPKESIYRCQSCRNSSDFCQVRVPFALKLLIQECSSLAVDMRLLTQ